MAQPFLAPFSLKQRNIVPRPVLWPIFLPPVPQSTPFPFLFSSQPPNREIFKPITWRSNGNGELGEAHGAAVVRVTFLKEVVPGWALKDG